MVTAYISLAYGRGPLCVGVLYSVCFPQKQKSEMFGGDYICGKSSSGFLK